MNMVYGRFKRPCSSALWVFAQPFGLWKGRRGELNPCNSRQEYLNAMSIFGELRKLYKDGENISTYLKENPDVVDILIGEINAKH